MIFLLLSSLALAADLPGIELFVAEPIIEISKSNEDEADANVVPQATARKRRYPKSGNLPLAHLQAHGGSTRSELIQPPKGTPKIFRALRVGESIQLRVNHSVIAFPDEKAPVVAGADVGRFRGLRFVGQSYLEPNSKRIFIDFDKVVVGHQIFRTRAVGVSSSGQPGLIGRYHSREAEYFAGDLVASVVAGYFDGLVPRTTNVFGQVETDTSVDSAVKKGFANGALSTADRFKEKLKSVPEFSEVEGPFDLQVLILDEAKATD